MEQLVNLTPDAEAAYGALLASHCPRKIRSSEEYDRLADELERITFADAPTPEEETYAELLEVLLTDFHEANPPFAAISPNEMLAQVLEQRELKQADLVPVIGSSAYVSQLVSGKRGISRSMAKRLGQFFNLDPALFLR
jgi:HTH-type transcriptional regulator/antitoxin HigA